MAVVFVAVLSKDNIPLYLRSYGVPSESELHFQYLVHTALDIIEEETSWEASPSAHSDPREYYLGLLSVTEEYKVYPERAARRNYGYATNTKVKLVLIAEAGSTQGGDPEMKKYLKGLHVAYVAAVCNPFYVPGEKIHTQMYAQRRVRDSFKESRGLSEHSEIERLYHKGLDTLALLRRQTTIGKMYQTDKLVIEDVNSN